MDAPKLEAIRERVVERFPTRRTTLLQALHTALDLEELELDNIYRRLLALTTDDSRMSSAFRTALGQYSHHEERLLAAIEGHGKDPSLLARAARARRGLLRHQRPYFEPMIGGAAANRSKKRASRTCSGLIGWRRRFLMRSRSRSVLLRKGWQTSRSRHHRCRALGYLPCVRTSPSRRLLQGICWFGTRAALSQAAMERSVEEDVASRAELLSPSNTSFQWNGKGVGLEVLTTSQKLAHPIATEIRRAFGRTHAFEWSRHNRRLLRPWGSSGEFRSGMREHPPDPRLFQPQRIGGRRDCDVANEDDRQYREPRSERQRLYREKAERRPEEGIQLIEKSQLAPDRLPI